MTDSKTERPVVDYSSAQPTPNNQTKTQRNSMPQKKKTTRTTEKKAGVKVQDLAPKKDAKGGGRVFTSASGKKESNNAPRPEGFSARG